MDDAAIALAEQEADMEVSFEKRFGWYVVTNRVTKGDITKHTQVYEKGIIEIMNQLVYLVEYDKEQQRMMREAQKRG